MRALYVRAYKLYKLFFFRCGFSGVFKKLLGF